MPVREYSINATVLATLWTGNPTDLDGFPDLNEFDCIIGADGSLTFRSAADWIKAKPHKHYIVRGVTGHYFLWPNETFNETYTQTP